VFDSCFCILQIPRQGVTALPATAKKPATWPRAGCLAIDLADLRSHGTWSSSGLRLPAAVAAPGNHGSEQPVDNEYLDDAKSHLPQGHVRSHDRRDIDTVHQAIEKPNRNVLRNLHHHEEAAQVGNGTSNRNCGTETGNAELTHRGAPDAWPEYIVISNHKNRYHVDNDGNEKPQRPIALSDVSVAVLTRPSEIWSVYCFECWWS